MNNFESNQPGDGAIARRGFIQNVAAASLPLAYVMGGGRLGAAESKGSLTSAPGNGVEPLSTVGMIILEKEPINIEMPFSTSDTFLTPNARFYVRTHFPIPQIETRDWKLKVEGEVEKPFELDYDELLKMEARTSIVTVECAGNGRVFLMPKKKGAQWELGGVGNAEWAGVPLAAVLERAKLKTGALEVILEGADKGEIEDPPHPAGKFHYARSLPIKKAVSDVLLATKMNGEPLPEKHGFPLRVIVPGWYGVASVKWLHRIIVTERAFAGFFQTVDYTYWERRDDDLPAIVPITELLVKSEISRPSVGEVVPADTAVHVNGAAWTSDAEVTKVEFSSDLGATWKEMHLTGKPTQNAWQLWEGEWHTPTKKGKQTLMARATDSRGRRQPYERDADRGSYLINHLLPIEVEVG